MEKLNLENKEKNFLYAKERLQRMRDAHRDGVVSKVFLLNSEKEFLAVKKELEEAQIRMKMAEEGVEESVKIAKNAVQDAQEALEHRSLQLKDYSIYAPVDGIIERVLIKEGEYNADPGKPGFVVVSGLWYDVYFDQSDLLYVKTGQEGIVRLEAYPGVTHKAVVSQITPVVSFNEGGPEISRPLRPRGSGAPEWAATFRSRMKFTAPRDEFPIAMGMTGFARLEVKRKGIAIPRAALLSVSAGAGIVYLPGEDNEWVARRVEIGIVDDFAAEVLSGLEEGEEIIIEGHWLIRETDQIEITDHLSFDYTKDYTEAPFD